MKNDLDFIDYLGNDLSKKLLVEAKKIYPGVDFRELNMLDLSILHNKYNVIFFIASFHHLNNIDDRIKVLKDSFDLLDE